MVVRNILGERRRDHRGHGRRVLEETFPDVHAPPARLVETRQTLEALWAVAVRPVLEGKRMSAVVRRTLINAIMLVLGTWAFNRRSIGVLAALL